jgi:hypothetical protein
LLVVILTGCGTRSADDPPAASDGPPTSTRTSTRTSTEAIQPTTPTRPKPVPATTTDAGTLPSGLAGTWESVAQGDAEDLIVFLPNGRFKRAQILMQQRRSGVYEYSIATTGTIRVTAAELVLTPESGTQKSKDPDSASGNWERPADLSPSRFHWVLAGDELRLTGEYGEVTYARN